MSGEPDTSLAGVIAARGFWDDPVQAWLDPPGDPRRLARMTMAFTLAAAGFGARGRIDFLGEDAVAMWLPPDPPQVEAAPARPDALALFDQAYAERIATLMGTLEAHHPAEPHWYLGLIATVPERRGGGAGSALIGRVLEGCDRDGIPSYLESSNPRNLSFYFRHGYEQIGEIVLPDGPSLFPMWRHPQPR